MTVLVGHFIVFTIVMIVFLILPLLIGKLLRPSLPTDQKLAIYECGEPTIGSSYVQFDLRFYVVALLFIIFDVEVAFFFPWALVYSGALHLADQSLAAMAPERIDLSARLLNTTPAEVAAQPGHIIEANTALLMAKTGFVDIMVFFGVLLVGFAYVWKRGDLDWVRAVSKHSQAALARPRHDIEHVEESKLIST